MQTFIKSGGGFIVLAAAFMVIGIVTEKSAVFIALAAVWLAVGIGMMTKRKKSSDQHDKDA